MWTLPVAAAGMGRLSDRSDPSLGYGLGSSMVVRMYSDGDVLPVNHAAGGSTRSERTTMTRHLQTSGRMLSVTKKRHCDRRWLRADGDDDDGASWQHCVYVVDRYCRQDKYYDIAFAVAVLATF